MYDTTSPATAEAAGGADSTQRQQRRGTRCRCSSSSGSTPDDGGQKCRHFRLQHGNAPAFPQPDFHLPQNENRHFTLCLQGCARFHARKIGEPPSVTLVGRPEGKLRAFSAPAGMTYARWIKRASFAFAQSVQG